jgi:hypothetical protein
MVLARALLYFLGAEAICCHTSVLDLLPRKFSSSCVYRAKLCLFLYELVGGTLLIYGLLPWSLTDLVAPLLHLILSCV